MDANAVVTAVVAALAVPGFFGVRAWPAGLLAGAIALNFPTYALGAFGVVLAVFLTYRLVKGEKSSVIDMERGEDGVWKSRS